MQPSELQKNSMVLLMDILETGDLKISSAYHFGDDLLDDECAYFEGLLTGLTYMLNKSPDLLVHIGTMVNDLGVMEAEDEFVFEPDEELQQAVEDAKVVRLHKDRLN